MFVLQLHYVGLHYPNNILWFVSQGVDTIVHQQVVKRPLIIYIYTWHRIVAVQHHWQRTGRDHFTEVEVLHIPLNL
jgi:hypothetical protein